MAATTTAGRATARHPAVKIAGLRYYPDTRPGITRKKSGKAFIYSDAKGEQITEKATLERIAALVIPPAWKDVWISPHARAHLQVTGYDARGRKQYIYHEKWRETREQEKYRKLFQFARCLPSIRKQIHEDLSLDGLPRRKVLAAVVRLLEATSVRIGNETYARQNESYGLTTLRNDHVRIRSCTLKFQFKGKSNKEHDISLESCTLAEVVKQCRAQPGEMLFQYKDEAGETRNVTSQDVNRYLREISGEDITAKDFRTWWATVLAALLLKDYGTAPSKTAAERSIRTMIKEVALHLGNTPTVCRKSYVDPKIVQAYREGRVMGRVVKGRGEATQQLLPEERAVVRFLKSEYQR